MYGRVIEEQVRLKLAWVNAGPKGRSGSEVQAAFSADGRQITTENGRFRLTSDRQDMRTATTEVFGATLSGALRPNGADESYHVECRVLASPDP